MYTKVTRKFILSYLEFERPVFRIPWMWTGETISLLKSLPNDRDGNI